MDQATTENPWQSYVWIDPKRMGGEPCFRGTRLPVRILFEYLLSGHTLAEFIDAFDGVPREKVVGVLETCRREIERLS